MTDNTRTRVRSRKSELRGGVTTTIFGRPAVSGEDGEFFTSQKNYQVNALVDPYESSYGGTGQLAILRPPENPAALLRMPNKSGPLRQCIDAMVTNICSFGYQLNYIGPEGQEESPASLAEKNRIGGLLEQPNGEYSLTELKERLRRDKETFGYCYYEVGRDLSRQVVLVNHVPSQTMRMTGKDPEQVPVDLWLKRNGKLMKVRINKRFRRFVQTVGTRTVYFKEFGDPRSIDPATGAVNATLALQDQATEIYHDGLYSPGTPYGMPRWLNEVVSMLGTHESQMTNLQFFKDNAMPAMAILVSGGALTGDSLRVIEEHFTGGRGRENMNRVVVIEATGDDTAAKIDGVIAPPRLEMKPLGADRQKEGMFLEYEDKNESKIRSCFRLPPIFVGKADDYTRATADTSLVLADGQVFGPERNKDDDLWNLHILSDDGKPNLYWGIRTNPPRLADPELILKALDTLDEKGALSPNICITIANELFDLSIPTITAPWGDYPFPIIMSLVDQGLLKGIEEIMGTAASTVDAANKGAANDTGPETVAKARVRTRLVGQLSAVASDQ